MEHILDWNEYIATSREAIAEGMVMLENNGALPLKEGSTVALFGRMQDHYYKSGTGSGGMVNVSRVWGIADGLKEAGITLCEELRREYAEWEKDNPIDMGMGWGQEPWSQKEMPVSDELAQRIAKQTDTAVCIIARTAGEEQDASLTGGSYLLTEEERSMLCVVREHFAKMVVLLNVGGLIDMKFVQEIKPDSVMYVWQGGMLGGLGTADVLTGKTSPSGKLSDTIAYEVADYPSAKDFGDKERNFYTEDIYVGYRWFETFAKDRVLYPFGYGLSYTTFSTKTDVMIHLYGESIIVAMKIKVKNTGSYKGKHVVQAYLEAPQGKLGKPSRVLCGFAKTKVLEPDEEQDLIIGVDLLDFASYDDSGATGNKSCYVLEKGRYTVYIGSDVRSAEKVWSERIEDEIIVDWLSEAYAPERAFERVKPMLTENGFVPVKEPVPTMTEDMDKRRERELPIEIPQTGDKGIKLADVRSGKNTMEQFIAQLSDEDLCCMARGEGMGSPRVTAGTASAFGGVSDRLTYFGIPCGCCSDGPSGMRLDCGTKAFSLPNGTLLASTFNVELVERLYRLAGLEIAANNVECLLGPGMNIHRHPLNGRNFEYFSEDPFLTGEMAAAQLKGLHQSGVTGTIKHFCGNNQETYRHESDSVISERALREIYLKGFEIAVKKGGARTIMTTYGSVNGLWTAGSYDLTTTILRNEWGFDGFVMTDWWADINERGKPQNRTNFAAMVRAQNDVYMVCSDGSRNSAGDNLMESLEAGTLTRGELQRGAMNVCRFLMYTRAMDRLCGTQEPVTVINRPAEDEGMDGTDVVFHKLNGELSIPLDGICTDKGTAYVFALDVQKVGKYRVTVTARSGASHTAQMPVTFFTTGYPAGMYTFSGTDGEWVGIDRYAMLYSRFIACRLYFGQSGLELRDISFTLEKETDSLYVD